MFCFFGVVWDCKAIIVVIVFDRGAGVRVQKGARFEKKRKTKTVDVHCIYDRTISVVLQTVSESIAYMK
jgi:hypothetical protein